MPRQRMVKPEFFDSESLALCSIEARLCFIGLWVMGDDYGNQKAQLSRLQNRIFPFDSMKQDRFLGMLCELEETGCIKGYEVDGERYINVPNFASYQTVKKPSASTVPEPPEKVRKAKRTTAIRQWGTSTPLVENQYPTSTPPVGEYPTSTPLVPHQYPTSSSEVKKERKKEVVVLQQQLPKEGTPRGAAVAEATPPAVPRCPYCEGDLNSTGLPEPEAWWCNNCKDFLASEKVVA